MKKKYLNIKLALIILGALSTHAIGQNLLIGNGGGGGGGGAATGSGGGGGGGGILAGSGGAGGIGRVGGKGGSGDSSGIDGTNAGSGGNGGNGALSTYNSNNIKITDNQYDKNWDIIAIGGSGGGGGGGGGGGPAGVGKGEDANNDIAGKGAVRSSGGRGGGNGGNGQSGALEIDNTTINVSNYIRVGGLNGGNGGNGGNGVGGSAGRAGDGVLTLSNGSEINIGKELIIGADGAGIVNLKDNSSINLGNSGTIVINSNGVLNIGGTINGLDRNTGGTISSVQDIQNSGVINFNQSDSVLISSSIIGVGSINVNGGDRGVTILEQNNSYVGGTTIISGTLQLGNGGTTGLVIGDITNNGTLAFNRSDSLTFGNVISGSGSVHQIGSGELVLSGNNSYSGETFVSKGSLVAGSANALAQNGKYTVKDGGTLNLNGYDLSVSSLNGENGVVDLGSGNLTFNLIGDSEFNGSINGAGGIDLNGAGQVLLLGGENTYTGETNINSGELRLNGSNAKLSGTNLVNISENGRVSGSGTIDGNVINKGAFFVGSAARSNLSSVNNFAVLGDFQNAGMIDLSMSGLDSTLNIGGDYIGIDGRLRLSTKLGDDSATTQLLSIDGNASGKTSVYVTNVDGLGGQTVHGIKVIEVAGTSNTDAFKLSNVVVAGNYEYQLQQSGEDWVLASHSINDNNGHDISWYRPDAGVNMGVGAVAVSLLTPEIGSFVVRDRGEKSSNVWMITDYRKTKGEGAHGQLSFKSTIKGIQLGVDHTFKTGDSSLVLGVMTSIHKIDGKASNKITSSRAISDTDAYGFGLYGTWYLDNTNLSPYIDVYAQYQKFKTTNKTRGNASYKYHSHGISFTTIGGYPIALVENIILEPQVQLGYVDYRSDTFRDHNGNLSKTVLKGNFIGRVGTVLTFNTDSIIEPYAGVSIWYDNTQVTTHYGDSIRLGSFEALKSYKNGTMFEGKLGFNARPSKDLKIWGEIKGLTGKQPTKNYGLSIGLEYNF
ncbi:autotransporter family protein [Wohlfahrtiimonas populi]|uniref:autotransporter family protein n=1 Tax=Wohlfahrtiimonas populi TaxID=1940240 RepID=UPI00098D4801|nr:autotransporter outer membrane beta-barrel domain-containing protein [Wohlfahrtiimonas populi]